MRTSLGLVTCVAITFGAFTRGGRCEEAPKLVTLFRIFKQVGQNEYGAQAYCARGFPAVMLECNSSQPVQRIAYPLPSGCTCIEGKVSAGNACFEDFRGAARGNLPTG
jgi:hypothetical protein